MYIFFKKQIWYFVLPIVIVFFVVVIIFPFFIKSRIKTELVTESKINSVHLKDYIVKNYLPDMKISSSEEGISSFDRLTQDINLFGFWKLRVFDSEGKIIYSTIPEEVGDVNFESYFHGFVAEGNLYSVLTKKNIQNQGKGVFLDVIETYVPVMENKQFKGAVKVYCNVTKRMKRANSFLWQIYAIVIFAIAVLSFVIVMAFIKISNFLKERESIIVAQTGLTKDLINENSNRKAIEEALKKEISEREKIQATLEKEISDRKAVENSLKEEIRKREKSDSMIRLKISELESFNKLAIGRETKMIELKREINKLLKELGRDIKYAKIDSNI